jgi:hypothetical protein
MSQRNVMEWERTSERGVFEIGVTRTFGLGDLSKYMPLTGYAAPEENHVWNDGAEASFVVTMQSIPTEQVILKVEGLPFVAEDLKSQDITLYFNGYRVGFWRLNAMDKTFLAAEIEPEYWLARDGGAYGKCVWHMPGSMRPSDVTGADDQREIGFCFQSIAIS